MVALLFSLYFICCVLALFSRHCLATGIFSITFILSIGWYFHHATDTLKILL